LVEGLAISVVLNLILIPWRERDEKQKKITKKKKKTEEEAEKSGIYVRCQQPINFPLDSKKKKVACASLMEYCFLMND
jgi:hypothetical protein